MYACAEVRLIGANSYVSLKEAFAMHVKKCGNTARSNPSKRKIGKQSLMKSILA